MKHLTLVEGDVNLLTNNEVLVSEEEDYTILRKLESGEIDGMQYIDGKNENGEDEILDAELFKASSIDSDSKDKNIYRPFNNA